MIIVQRNLPRRTASPKIALAFPQSHPAPVLLRDHLFVQVLLKLAEEQIVFHLQRFQKGKKNLEATLLQEVIFSKHSSSSRNFSGKFIS